MGVFSLPANALHSVCASASARGGTGRITQIKVGQLISSLLKSSQEVIHNFSFSFLSASHVLVMYKPVKVLYCS